MSTFGRSVAELLFFNETEPSPGNKKNMSAVKTSELERFGFEIINHLQESIYLLEVLDNFQFVLFEANPQFEEEVGKPLGQCIGRGFDDFLDPESARILNLKHRHCVETSETITGTIELMLSNGKKSYHCTFIPIKDETKTVRRIIGINNRIPNEKSPVELYKSQHPYLQEQSPLKSLVEEAPFGIVLLNEMTTAFINRALFSFVGVPYTKNVEMIDLLEFVHPDDRKSLLRLIKTIFENEQNRSYQLSVRSAKEGFSDMFFDLYLAAHSIGGFKEIHIIVVDISNEIEKEKLLSQLAFMSLLSTQKNDVIIETYNELETIIKEKNYNSGAFEGILNKLETFSDNKMDWVLFSNHIETLCPDFITNLRVLNPSLTANDIKHCACIRLNYDTKETAKFFNVTPTSIQTARVRLKKKLHIPEKIDLREFLVNL
jgi:hypothetical protein